MNKIIERAVAAHAQGLLKHAGNFDTEQYARNYRFNTPLPSYAGQDGWLPWLREKTDFSTYTPEQRRAIEQGAIKRRANWIHDINKWTGNEQGMRLSRISGQMAANKAIKAQQEIKDMTKRDARGYWQKTLDDTSRSPSEHAAARSKLHQMNVDKFYADNGRAPTYRELRRMGTPMRTGQKPPTPVAPAAAPGPIKPVYDNSGRRITAMPVAPAPAPTAAAPAPAPAPVAPAPVPTPVAPATVAPAQRPPALAPRPVAQAPAPRPPALAPRPVAPAGGNAIGARPAVAAQPAKPAVPAKPPAPARAPKPFAAPSTPIKKR
jgi:hypothetical protein